MMAIAETSSGSAAIGEAAGIVWRVLATKGPLSLTKLIKESESPRELVLQAVGWLAREDKLVFEEGARTKTIGLKDC
ncbi:MAG: winged helix-turn-helix domain-containing protein [Pirellulales bacterium]